MSDVILGGVWKVTASVLTTLLSFAAGALWGLYKSASRRKKMLRFLGITDGANPLHLYLSRIYVAPGTAKPVEEQKVNEGYHGPAINKTEYAAAVSLQAEITRLSVVLWSRKISEWLMTRFFQYQQVEVIIDTSPQHCNEYRPDGTTTPSLSKETLSNMLYGKNVILIGNGIYNNLSNYALSHRESRINFVRPAQPDGASRLPDLVVQAFDHGQPIGQPLICKRDGPHDSRCEFFFVQRIVIDDGKNKTTITVCAGTCAATTLLSVDHLIIHWQEYQRDYGDNPFKDCWRVYGLTDRESSPKGNLAIRLEHA